MRQAIRAGGEGRGFLTRLRRDTSGNTLAMMAAALIPLCGFAGSAMDMARLYVVKVRLQQACDAGALAGRKFLAGGTAANQPLTGNALAQANTYFNTNLTSSWFGSNWYTDTTQSFTPRTVADAQNNTQVQAQAQVDVPMTIMRMFGFTAQTIQVQCQAVFSTPDTDVMFVLDTTGTMGCAITRNDADCNTYIGTGSNVVANGSGGYRTTEEMANGKNVSRIDALRQAVNQFYTTVSTTKDVSTHVRYGFVPYTATVNVGSLLYGMSTSYLVNKWTYQSRIATGDQVLSTTAKPMPAADQNACNAYAQRTPASRAANAAGDANAGYPNNGTATNYRPVWTPQTGNGKGTGNGNSPAVCTVNADIVGPVWTYQPATYDVSNYLTRNQMVDPSRVDGSKTIWNGCIEERDTTPGVTDFSQGPLPSDLDPDAAPTSDATRWRPMWPTVEWARQYGPYAYDNAVFSVGEYNSCPAAAKPLFLPDDTASGAATINNYVAGLQAYGYTYHDVGMVWGTRLLSPTGLWASNNAWPTGRAAPNRVLVFVTDGVMEPNSNAYGAYGMELYDRRVTGSHFGKGDPSAGNNQADYINFHNQRFLAECALAKSSPLKFDVWVVEVAQASSDQLTKCASRPTQVLVGQTSDQLTTAFKTIAQQVALLRVQQ